MNLPVIETHGSPYEMGYQHGQQAAALVRATYERFCGRFGPLDAARLDLRERIEATVAARRPQALQEMRGLADGSGLGYDEVRTLNYSIELWAETWLSAPPPRACTLIGLNAGPGGWSIGKTLDVTPGDEQYLLIQRAAPEAGQPFLHVTYAGTIWTDGGVNQAGLVEVNSSLETSARNLDGYPVFMMTRDLLQHCASVGAAAQMAAASDAINFGSNLLLADAAGDCAVVERSVTRHGLRRPAPGERILFATNHSLTPDLESVAGGGADLAANSRERYEFVSSLAPAPDDPPETLPVLFRDHTRPGGLCQHGQGGLHTIGSFIAGSAARRLWIAAGAPCENPYELYAL
jgi:isopenicillin-N N-acyltransferase like protein